MSKQYGDLERHFGHDCKDKRECDRARKKNGNDRREEKEEELRELERKERRRRRREEEEQNEMEGEYEDETAEGEEDIDLIEVDGENVPWNVENDPNEDEIQPETEDDENDANPREEARAEDGDEKKEENSVAEEDEKKKEDDDDDEEDVVLIQSDKLESSGGGGGDDADDEEDEEEEEDDEKAEEKEEELKKKLAAAKLSAAAKANSLNLLNLPERNGTLTLVDNETNYLSVEEEEAIGKALAMEEVKRAITSTRSNTTQQATFPSATIQQKIHFLFDLHDDDDILRYVDALENVTKNIIFQFTNFTEKENAVEVSFKKPEPQMQLPKTKQYGRARRLSTQAGIIQWTGQSHKNAEIVRLGKLINEKSDGDWSDAYRMEFGMLPLLKLGAEKVYVKLIHPRRQDGIVDWIPDEMQVGTLEYRQESESAMVLWLAFGGFAALITLVSTIMFYYCRVYRQRRKKPDSKMRVSDNSSILVSYDHEYCSSSEDERGRSKGRKKVQLRDITPEKKEEKKKMTTPRKKKEQYRDENKLKDSLSNPLHGNEKENSKLRGKRKRSWWGKKEESSERVSASGNDKKWKTYLKDKFQSFGSQRSLNSNQFEDIPIRKKDKDNDDAPPGFSNVTPIGRNQKKTSISSKRSSSPMKNTTPRQEKNIYQEDQLRRRTSGLSVQEHPRSPMRSVRGSGRNQIEEPRSPMRSVRGSGRNQMEEPRSPIRSVRGSGRNQMEEPRSPIRSVRGSGHSQMAEPRSPMRSPRNPPNSYRDEGRSPCNARSPRGGGQIEEPRSDMRSPQRSPRQMLQQRVNTTPVGHLVPAGKSLLPPRSKEVSQQQRSVYKPEHITIEIPQSHQSYQSQRGFYNTSGIYAPSPQNAAWSGRSPQSQQHQFSSPRW